MGVSLIVNKFRVGHPEISIVIWIVSVTPLAIILFMEPPLMVTILIFLSIFIGVFAITWLPYYVSKFHLRPAIDKCKSDETTWLRITKDRIILPQFVDKGPYGQTKGVTNGEKADVIDDGSFPCNWQNGSRVKIMYDLMNTNADLNKSVARNIMKKKFKVRSGVEAYKLAKKNKMRVLDE